MVVGDWMDGFDACKYSRYLTSTIHSVCYTAHIAKRIVQITSTSMRKMHVQ